MSETRAQCGLRHTSLTSLQQTLFIFIGHEGEIVFIESVAVYFTKYTLTNLVYSLINKTYDSSTPLTPHYFLITSSPILDAVSCCELRSQY